MIERRNQCEVLFGEDGLSNVFPTFPKAVVGDDCCTVTFSRLAFRAWGVVRHHDSGRNTKYLGGSGNGLGMIAGGVGDNSSRPNVAVECCDGVERSSELERAGVLQMFGF